MNWKRISWTGKKIPALLALGVVSWGLGGCDTGTSPELSTVVVLITDEPSDMLETVEVWISRIYLQGEVDEGTGEGTEGEDPPSGRVDLFTADGDPAARQVFDLLTLQNGITADATGEVPVDAGTYHQLRFVVDSTWVTLREGFTFEDGSTEGGFKVPSGEQSGIKVQLQDGVLDAGAGQVLTITVDFPVDDNFVIQQTQDPNVIRRIMFTPMLKEKERSTEES
jgi:hypothetical protein